MVLSSHELSSNVPAQNNAGPLLYMVIGGGILAGTLGMLFFYRALSAGELSKTPIAFTSPVYGALMG